MFKRGLHILVQMFLLLLNISHLFLDTPICSLVLKMQAPLPLCIPLFVPIKEIMDLQHIHHLLLFHLIKEAMFHHLWQLLHKVSSQRSSQNPYLLLVSFKA
jgi:hypothetical protein